MHDGRLHTFSAGFGHPAVDAVDHARRVSAHLGTTHHEVTVTPADFERLWPLLTWHRDAPISEPADIAVFRLAETARRHVKVVLSGEGSDELFAGYPKHRFARLTAYGGAVPHALRHAVGDRAERRLPSELRRARIAVRALSAGDRAQRFDAWFAPFTASERRALLGPGAVDAPTPRLGGGDPVRQMLLADCQAWLADNLLERGDRMSMAASLELRPPFLDHHLVELAFSLPSDVKIRHGETKWVVKQIARGLLPPGIAERPKAGFRVPLADWFRGSLRAFARERLLDPGSFAMRTFERPVVLDLLARHASGRHNEDIRIWTLLSLEVWHDRLRSDLADDAAPTSRGRESVE
jgi:asparagine synthase (glutamine-hydrolysing)